MKARISFDLDLSDYALANEEDVQALINDVLLRPARSHAIKGLHAVRKRDDTDLNSKAVDMGTWLQRIKLTLCADANMNVTPLSDDAPINVTLPFEGMQQDTKG